MDRSHRAASDGVLKLSRQPCKDVKMPVQWVELWNFFVNFPSVGRIAGKEGDFEWIGLIELHLMVY